MTENQPRRRPPKLIPEEELTIDNFWQRWGETCGFDQETLRELWDFSESQYINLPAHNFTHAKDTLWKAMEYTDLCEANGVKVNRKLLVGTSLLHDAAVHEPLDGSGFSTKEERSASIWGTNAGKFGYDAEDTADGKRVIIATDSHHKPLTIEEKIMVRADISNVGGDYIQTFRVRTQQFIDEARQLDGPKFNQARFIAGSIRTLLRYTANDLSFGPFDDQKWSNHVILNLKRLARSYAAREGLTLPVYLARRIGDTAVNGLSGVPLSKIIRHGNDKDSDG